MNLMSKLWLHRILTLLTVIGYANAFRVSSSHRHPSSHSPSQQQRRLRLEPILHQSNNGDDNSGGVSSVVSRFTSPKIDDPGLPLSDGLVAQVIAPSLEIGARLALHIPPPSWLVQSTDPTQLLFNNRPGGFLAPTLIHGAALAVTWLVGALAAKAYERPSISPVKDDRGQWDYSRVYLSLFQAGAGTAGVWILATQLDVYLDLGGYAQWGDSTEADARLLVAASESIADFVFEAITISFWRLYLAYQTERMNQE